jgi:hypothetical protein
MARRTNLISAILGGVGGGIEAGLEQRERTLSARERAEERQREAERLAQQTARQGQLDIAAMADKPGWTTPEARTTALRGAAPGLQEVMGMVPGMLGREAPRGLSEAGQAALSQAAGQFGAPSARVTLGGQEFVQAETPTQRAMREAAATAGQERRKTQEATQAARAEEARKIQARIDAGESREEATASVIAGRAPTAKILPPWQREGFGSEAEYLDFLGAKEARTRAPRTPGATPEQALAERIDAAVLQYSRQQVPGLPGMPAQFPTEPQVRQYRDLLRRTMGLEAATPAASGGPGASRDSLGGASSFDLVFGQPSRPAAGSVGPARTSSASPEPPRSAPPAPAFEPTPNPLRGGMTEEEAARLGVDLERYASEPAYRQFVDRKRRTS